MRFSSVRPMLLGYDGSKTVMDRAIAQSQPGRNLTSKVAGVLAVCGSLRLVDALKNYSYFLVQRRMLPANEIAAYVTNPGEIKNMVQCMSAFRRMGQQMAALIKMNLKYQELFKERHEPYGANRK